MSGAAPPGGEYRYERKFAVADAFRWQAEESLLRASAHFAPIHRPRWVNNIYLDTPEWTSFRENRDGAGDLRAKVRIRWYGDYQGAIERPVLEVKVRSAYVNRKRAYPLAPLRVDAALSWGRLLELFAASELPESLRLELGRLQPALGNRYHRSYFLSASGNVRATVDTELAFLRLTRGPDPLVAWSSDPGALVVELKYPLECDAEAREIAHELPFRLTRSSKYATGVLRVAA